jgi:transcriptional regulator with XRE-family HTH domain
MVFSEQLRKLREAKGFTQGEVAERAGVPFRSYQNWELGVREPRLPVLPSLAKALGVNLDELLVGVDKPAKPKTAKRKGK